MLRPLRGGAPFAPGDMGAHGTGKGEETRTEMMLVGGVWLPVKSKPPTSRSLPQTLSRSLARTLSPLDKCIYPRYVAGGLSRLLFLWCTATPWYVLRGWLVVVSRCADWRSVDAILCELQ